MRAVIGGSITSAVTHLAALGLAQIAVDAGCGGVRTWWEDGRPASAHVSWDGDQAVGELLRTHVGVHARSDSWVSATFDHLGRTTAVFSPRIKAPRSRDAWARLLSERRSLLDAVELSRLDCLMIGALGEQAYWLWDEAKGFSDQGASRWEMKTRNRGEEFVQHRLARLAFELADWPTAQMESGVCGRSSRDCVGKDSPSSRTPTGLTRPGPLDNALAWCAFWGLAGLQTVPLPHRLSASVGVDPEITATHPSHMAIPVFTHPVYPALWRETAASKMFAQAAFGQADLAASGKDWLRTHGVAAITTFATVVAGSSSAPERYLLPGRIEVL